MEMSTKQREKESYTRKKEIDKSENKIARGQRSA